MHLGLPMNFSFSNFFYFYNRLTSTFQMSLVTHMRYFCQSMNKISDIKCIYQSWVNQAFTVYIFIFKFIYNQKEPNRYENKVVNIIILPR